jgi:hypothetical protein
MAQTRKTSGSVQSKLVRSAEFIGWALAGVENEMDALRARLASLTDQADKLRRRLGRRGATSLAAQEPAAKTRGGRRKRRRMSAEARRRISEMMKKRWAERKRKAAK